MVDVNIFRNPFGATAADLAAALGYVPADAARTSRILGQSGQASATLTGTTAKTSLGSVIIPGGLMGLRGGLRIKGFFSYTNSASIKTILIEFPTGGSALGTGATTTATAQFDLMIWNNNSLVSQKFFNSIPDSGLIVTAIGSMAANTAVDQTLNFSGQLASGADSLILQSYSVELLPGV